MRNSLSGQVINWAGWFLRSGEAPNPGNIVKSCSLEFWFDGQDTGTLLLNGNKVIQWDDKSGFARHVANAVDARRPTYNPATGRVTFVDANDTYLQSSNFGELTQPNTIFMVCKLTNAAVVKRVFSSNVGLRVEIHTTGGNMRMYAGANLTYGVIDANDNIHTTEWNGIASNYWINGILDGSPANAGANGLNQITLGAQDTNVGSSIDGQIMEVFGYNCSLTNREHSKCFDYINNKWSLGY